MINREDMLELTRRMTPARSHIDRIAGAYYDAEGYIDGTFNTHFLKLSTAEKTKNLEDMPITGISIKEDYAIMRVNDLPNDGIFLGELFTLIAKLDINLDTISQQLTHDGKVNFSFYCNKKQSDTILKHIDERSEERL